MVSNDQDRYHQLVVYLIQSIRSKCTCQHDKEKCSAELYHNLWHGP